MKTMRFAKILAFALVLALLGGTGTVYAAQENTAASEEKESRVPVITENEEGEIRLVGFLIDDEYTPLKELSKKDRPSKAEIRELLEKIKDGDIRAVDLEDLRKDDEEKKSEEDAGTVKTEEPAAEETADSEAEENDASGEPAAQDAAADGIAGLQTETAAEAAETE